MTMRKSAKAAAMLLALPLALSGAAVAHHGWGWTQDQESRLTGEIVSITFTNPHMQLQLRQENGALWAVDLSPPIVAASSGFGSEHAAAGDRAVITGHRARDMAVNAFKGETITVRGRTFDVYPQREKTLNPSR